MLWIFQTTECTFCQLHFLSYVSQPYLLEGNGYYWRFEYFKPPTNALFVICIFWVASTTAKSFLPSFSLPKSCYIYNIFKSCCCMLYHVALNISNPQNALFVICIFCVVFTAKSFNLCFNPLISGSKNSQKIELYITAKSFRNLCQKSNRNHVVFTIFRLVFECKRNSVCVLEANGILFGSK